MGRNGRVSGAFRKPAGGSKGPKDKSREKPSGTPWGWSESWGAAPKTTRIVGAHWSLIKTMSKGAMACDYLIYCAKRDSVCTGKSSPTLWWSAV